MSTNNQYVADLLHQLLTIDKTTNTIQNGVLTITQNGKNISLPIDNNSVIRSSISTF